MGCLAIVARISVAAKDQVPTGTRIRRRDQCRKWSEAIAAFERAYQIAPSWTITAGWLAAALWQRDEKARARQLIIEMGDSPMPLWGRVVYHLLTSDLDAAADWTNA